MASSVSCPGLRTVTLGGWFPSVTGLPPVLSAAFGTARLSGSCSRRVPTVNSLDGTSVPSAFTSTMRIRYVVRKSANGSLG